MKIYICERCSKTANKIYKKNCKKCYDHLRWKNRYNNFLSNEESHKEFLKQQKKIRKSRKKPEDRLKKGKSGSGTITWQGYRRLPGRGHPNSQKSSGCILEHVLVMSNHLKRPLCKVETVHHRNGDKLDNRIENLELWNHAHGPGQRIEDKIKWCREFIKQYEKEFP